MNFGILYGIVLMIFLVLGFWGSTFKKNLYFYLSDFLIAIPAFFVRPGGFYGWDTIRFVNLLDTIRSLDLNSITNGLQWGLRYSVYSNQPVVVLYIWLMSFFKNDGVFFYLTILIFLFTLSKLIVTSLKEVKVKNKFIGILVQFIILMIFNLFFEVEGVRNFLAFDIFATSFYIDMHSSNKLTKFKCWIAYFLAYSFHPAVIPFIIFRIILLFKSKILNNVTKLIALFYTFFNSQILSFFNSIPFIAPLITRSNNYFYGQNNYAAYTGRAEIFFTTLILIYLIIELIIYQLEEKNKNNNDQHYIEFYIICALFTIGSFLNIQVYLRSIMLLLFLSIPIKIELFDSSIYLYNKVKNAVIIWNYKYFSIIFAFIMFCHWYIQTYSHVPALSF